MLSSRRAASIKPNTRAMIAFVAGELILRKGMTKIYDYSSGQTLNFRARFSEFDVDVTELGSKVQLSGGAFGKHFSLTHYGEDSRIELNIAGMNFDGEHSKGPHFKGFVRDNLVTIKEGTSQFVFGMM
ncbi:MAG: hypothetical protein JW942_09155 [Opitutales bacterium]|nr:hypothetical protein [Opitutales bacterium]